MHRRRYRIGVVFAIASLLVFAATSGASRCPMDAAGTRTLDVTGDVAGYALRGTAVAIAVRDRHGCQEAALWQPYAGRKVQTFRATRIACRASSTSPLGRSVVVPRKPHWPLRASEGALRVVAGAAGPIDVYEGTARVRRIPRVATSLALKIALNGDRLVVLAKGSSRLDRPFRLEVYDTRTGRVAHDWPLLGRPTTLDVHGDIALFSSRDSGGVFALRLSDGRTTNLGPVRPGDTPQIGRSGVVFQSNRQKRLNRQGRVLMKFLPTAVVSGELERTVDTLERRWPIKAFAMDGPRVAVVLDAPKETCDAVGFWNVPRHWFVRVNMIEDLTCSHHMEVGGELAIAGIGAGWVGTKAGASTIFFSNTTSCVEEVAGTTTSSATPVAGDGSLLAYGGIRAPDSGGEAVALVNWGTEKEVLVRSSSPARALAVDQNRVAVLRADGRIELLASDGSRIATFDTGSPQAVALRGRKLVVVTRAGELEIWNVRTRVREHTWSLPAGTAPAIDAQYGIAVFTAARTVYALRLDTGRVVALARTHRGVRVQIEAPGVVYTYNAHGRGIMRFVRLAVVERALGLK